MAVEDRMDSFVRVEWNAGADGSLADVEGAVAPVWQLLPGIPAWLPNASYAALSCLIYEDQSQRAPGQDFSEDLTTAIIMFPSSSGLPRDKLLRFGLVDPGSGKTIWYYANGKVTSPAGAYLRVRVRLGAIE